MRDIVPPAWFIESGVWGNHFFGLSLGLYFVHFGFSFNKIYQKKKPSGQAEAIVKESIDSDKPIHAENRGSPGVAEQSTTCS